MANQLTRALQAVDRRANLAQRPVVHTAPANVLGPRQDVRVHSCPNTGREGIEVADHRGQFHPGEPGHRRAQKVELGERAGTASVIVRDTGRARLLP